MTDAHPPGSQPPPPPPPESPPPSSGGMSSGTKVLIGCGVVALIGGVAVVAAIVVGGMFVSRTASDFVGGFEAQQQASEAAQAMEQRHTFRAPDDGVVDPARARVFVSATDEMWNRLEPWLREMEARGERLRDRDDLRGLADAWRGLQGLGQARIDMIDVLEDHDMPLSEYLWTGTALFLAYADLDLPPEHRRVPARNLEVARQHQAFLGRMAAERDRDGGPAAVMALAWMFGAAEGIEAHGATWEAMRRAWEEEPPR